MDWLISISESSAPGAAGARGACGNSPTLSRLPARAIESPPRTSQLVDEQQHQRHQQQPAAATTAALDVSSCWQDQNTGCMLEAVQQLCGKGGGDFSGSAIDICTVTAPTRVVSCSTTILS